MFSFRRRRGACKSVEYRLLVEKGLRMETDSMPLFDNESRILQIEKEKAEIFQYMKNP